jgi:hypothetical protein
MEGCVLAGGTALAGFYAAHRKSDDLDLFTSDESHQRSTVLAIKSLQKLGVILQMQNETAQYFEASGTWEGHVFKVTSVVDSHLLRVADVVRLSHSMQVVGLETLFKMKSATLVSRCSEKDLYDLIWLFDRFPDWRFADLVTRGNEIDAGVTGEAILLSVGGTTLRKGACDFGLQGSPAAEQIFGEIQAFRKHLLKGIEDHIHSRPTHSLGELIKTIRDKAEQ